MEKSPNEMRMDEFLEWSIQFAVNGLLIGRSLREILSDIITRVLYNELFGGRRP